jgi:hypothetical protein
MADFARRIPGFSKQLNQLQFVDLIGSDDAQWRRMFEHHSRSLA